MSDALGLESGHAKVVAYDPRWPLLFDDVATQFRDLLGSRILEIEHVGSTSVPGLAAKPILDILVGVDDFDRSRELFTDLRSLGFEHRPNEEIPDRHFFRKRAGGTRTHHLSLATPDSSHYRETVIFRDALRSDAALARSYEDLKVGLARRHPRDRVSYQNGKSGFVLNALRMHRVASGGPIRDRTESTGEGG